MGSIIPVITEKSMKLAKVGKYVFLVDKNLSKHQIKKEVEKIFKVNVIDVNTLSLGGELKRDFRGRKIVISKKRKAIVTLKDGEKIELFEEEKK